MQSAHACAVQTHFFLFALRPEKWCKKPPKMESRGTPNHTKSRKTGTQKNNKNWIQKVWILTSKRRYLFVPETSLKSQKSNISSIWASKSPNILKNLQKLNPRASKTIQNGKLFFMTDHQGYFDWSKDMINESVFWKLSNEPWPHDHTSYFRDILPDNQYFSAKKL